MPGLLIRVRGAGGWSKQLLLGPEVDTDAGLVESAANPFRNSGRVVIGGENPLAALAEAKCLDGGDARPRPAPRPGMGPRGQPGAIRSEGPSTDPTRVYSAPAARANGLPSESRQIAQRSPGWTIENPPSSRTRSRGGGHVLDGEIGKRAGVSGPGAAPVDTEPQAAFLGFPALARAGGARGELDTEQSAPEPEGPIRVVGGELDQGRAGHDPPNLTVIGRLGESAKPATNGGLR